MNRLAAAFESRGLTIIGVTDEDEQETDAWIRRNRAKYAYAFDSGGRLSSWFGIRSIPHAVLVDPSGVVLWRGHPARLKNSTIDSALESARAAPFAKWPERTRELQKLLVERRYAQAVAAAVTLGEPYKSFVQDRVRAMVDSVRTIHDTGDYSRACAIGRRVADELAGLREATEVKSFVDAMRRDTEIQRVIRGQKRLQNCARTLGTVRRRTEGDRLRAELEELKREFKGTLVGAQAATCLTQLLGRRLR